VLSLGVFAAIAAHTRASQRKRSLKPEYKACWDSLKALALALDLPGIEEAASRAPMKAHGKLWFWWSPHEDAPVFKVPFKEREFLIEVDPTTFFFTPHYRNYPMVLVRPDKLDPDWARANLIKVWRAQAPKRLLKVYDAARAPEPRATEPQLEPRPPRSKAT
jgi:hypothetical protein